jgi:hypothetical protein
MSDDEIKAAAVEAVRQHLELSDKTRVRMSIKMAITVCFTIIGATWVMSRYMLAITNGQERLEAALNSKVSYAQFEAWTRQLDRMNRVSMPAMVVPELPAEATASDIGSPGR